MASAEDDFPREKLVNQLASIEEDTRLNYQLICLLTTGSLNPVHIGHVQSFEAAKEALEKQTCNVTGKPFKVLAGFVSPSDRGWCDRKEYGALTNQYRLHLVEKAVEDSEWIDAAGWEITRNNMVDFPEVMGHFQEWLNNSFSGTSIRAYYLCGADHATKCGLVRGRSRYGVCVMNRPGYTVNGKPPSKREVVFVESEGIDMSSTQVRACLCNNGVGLSEYEDMLHPSVYESLQMFVEHHGKVRNLTRITTNGSEPYFDESEASLSTAFNQLGMLHPITENAVVT